MSKLDPTSGATQYLDDILEPKVDGMDLDMGNIDLASSRIESILRKTFFSLSSSAVSFFSKELAYLVEGGLEKSMESSELTGDRPQTRG